MTFKNKKILITGGLGFLGSNLALKLMHQGANVTIVDNLDPTYGGNLYNIESFKENIRLVIGDICESKIVEDLVADKDYIFHFAAQVSYIDSIAMPYKDLELNSRSTLQILEVVRRINPQARIIFASSRMVLGKIGTTPYSEDSTTLPLSLYGIHKLTSEKYLLMYFKDFGIKSTIFRITNPYGPRQQIKHSKYSLPGWFVRCAMENQTIKIYGEGNQIRNYIYIEDIIKLMMLCTLNENSFGEIINMGTGDSCTFKEMVQIVVDVVGKGDYMHVPWPANYERLETGDSVPDISKLKRLSGYFPSYSLKRGISETFKYYQKNWDKYVQ